MTEDPEKSAELFEFVPEPSGAFIAWLVKRGSGFGGAVEPVCYEES